MPEFEIDEDATKAAYDLFRRCGAKESQFGYVDESDPVDWYAWVRFHNGEKVMVRGKSDPVAALEALARRLLNGSKCTHCLQIVTLSGKPRAGICRWTRQSGKWVRGCEATHAEKQLLVRADEFDPGGKH